MRKKEKRPVVFVEAVPEWLVTFGDMMSLLLTFFILLFSVSEIREESKIYDLVVTFQGKTSQKRPVYGYMLPRLEMSPDGLMRDLERDPGEVGEAGVTSRKIPDPEGEHTHVISVDSNLYLRLGGDVLFEEGESFLLDEGREVLSHLAQEDLGAGRFRVVVLGHVSTGEVVGDVEQYGLGFRRARGIRDYLVQLGIPEAGIEVQSAGSRLPVKKDSDSPEALALNRRTQIFVSARGVGADPEG